MTLALSEPDALAVALPVVRMASLSKWIDDRPILRDIDLELPAGGYAAILGPNGAGKSTLLHVIATLVPATEGTLSLFGQDVSRGAAAVRAIRGRLGLIGHQAMLYRDLSAWENLVFFGKLYGLAHVEDRAAELLDMVGLTDRADDAVKTFSRGMTQRIAIARALMHDPQLLLADEPFAGLDVPSTRTLEELLASLYAAGKSILLVNHDVTQSLRLAQRVIVLRQGAVVYDRPARQSDAKEVTAEVCKP